MAAVMCWGSVCSVPLETCRHKCCWKTCSLQMGTFELSSGRVSTMLEIYWNGNNSVKSPGFKWFLQESFQYEARSQRCCTLLLSNLCSRITLWCSMTMLFGVAWSSTWVNGSILYKNVRSTANISLYLRRLKKRENILELLNVSWKMFNIYWKFFVCICRQPWPGDCIVFKCCLVKL